MLWFVRLLALIPALGGFAAACLLVPDGQALQVPTVPTVSVPTATVTTPTVSVPVPVPVPSTPTATVTVAPPPVPAPTVPTTAPVPAPVPAPSPPPVRLEPPAPPPVSLPGTTTVPVPSGAPSTTGSSTPSPAPGSPGTAASGGSSEAEPAGSSGSGGSAAGVAGVAVIRGPNGTQTGSRPLGARAYRTKNRVSVRLRFSLPAAGRLFLIVRGPAPSCRVAGVVPLRGRRGVNTVYFAGRVHGRRLEPGLYRLSLSTTRRPQPGAPATTVRVVSARRSVPVQRPGLLASCTPAQAFFDDGTRRFLVAETVGQQQQQRPTASVAGLPAVRLQPPKQRGSAADGDDELAGGLVPVPGEEDGDSGGGGLESFAAVILLLIVASLLFGMVTLVTRFLRGSWNP